MSLTSVDLPEPETPVDNDHYAQRKSYIKILEIIFLRPKNREPCPILLTALRPHLDLHFARDIRPGERLRLAHNLLRSSVGYQAAAVASCAGSEIDHVIRAANGFFVVLDHQHRVAQVAQIFQRGQQAAVVAMMQPNRWLVQNVKNTTQL